MTLNNLKRLREIFNDSKHRAVSATAELVVVSSYHQCSDSV